jgi:lysophospholipase L1-like esterase
VAGVGDAQCLGWAGRLAQRAIGAGQPLTYYNLGVRGQTSADIAVRWEAECAQRLTPDVDARVVFSFGVNDTAIENGRTRVAERDSVAHLTAMLRRAAERDWHMFVVAPPPNTDDEHNGRSAALDIRFTEVCAAPWYSVHSSASATAAEHHLDEVDRCG